MPLVGSYGIDITADVVDVDVPFLFDLDALTKPGVVRNVENDVVTQLDVSFEVPLVREYGHLYVK